MKTRTLWIIALLAVSALALAGCKKTENVPAQENVEIPNPASVYCEENAWTLNLEEWLCMFEDGSYCEEWAYYRNECQPGEIIYNTTDNLVWMANPASVYCVEQWGELVPMEDEEWNQYAMCRFPDGTEVEEWEYYRANNLVEEVVAEEAPAEEVVAEETPTEEVVEEVVAEETAE